MLLITKLLVVVVFATVTLFANTVLQTTPAEPRSYEAFALPNTPVVFATNTVLLVVLFAATRLNPTNAAAPESVRIVLVVVPLSTTFAVVMILFVELITPAMFAVLEILTVDNVVKPVTPRVFDAVIALLTARVLFNVTAAPNVAAPDVVKVLSVVAPVTPKVPPTLALDVTLAVPITFRLVPENVRFALSLTAPPTPEYVILESVKSLTVKDWTLADVNVILFAATISRV